MKILKRSLGVILVLIVVAGIVGLFLPNKTHVERSATFMVPPASVFPYVNDFRRFNMWSPWAARDANTKYTFEGPAAGVGSKMYWESDHPEVGSGSQEITESLADQLVRTRLEFSGQGNANAYFDLTPDGAGTKLTWGLDIEHGLNPINRYFGLLLDKWVGTEYEKGLLNLKQFAEAS